MREIWKRVYTQDDILALIEKDLQGIPHKITSISVSDDFNGGKIITGCGAGWELTVELSRETDSPATDPIIFEPAWIKEEKAIHICKFLRQLDPSMDLLRCKHLAEYILGRNLALKASTSSREKFIEACYRGNVAIIQDMSKVVEKIREELDTHKTL